MTKLHEEIKKLIEASKTPSIQTADPVIPPASAPVQRPATHATPSAEERERPQMQKLRNNGPNDEPFSAATADTNMLEL